MKQPPALSNSTGQDENNKEIISDSEKRSDCLPEQVSDSESEIQIESKDASTPAPGSKKCEAESPPPVSVLSKECVTVSVSPVSKCDAKKPILRSGLSLALRHVSFVAQSMKSNIPGCTGTVPKTDTCANTASY